MQHSAFVLGGRLKPPRIGAHTLRVEIRKCIYLRIQPLDLLYVRLSQFRNRNLAHPQHR